VKTIAVGKKGFLPSEVIEAEIDIDVKPILNVLIILIPFLVSVAVYTNLAVIDMSLPPNVTAAAGAGVANEKPKLKITVVVAQSFCAITLGEQLLDSIPRAGSDYAYDTLAARLSARQAAADVKDEVIVAARDKIQFKYVVRIMDACKKTGFEKVSLASATENPGSGQ
jgi:biopolymer transport protein ExbD